MWQQPMKNFNITCAFGVVDANHPNGHRGDDYVGEDYALAVNDGTIVYNGFSSALGNVVILKVDKWYYGYCHLAVKPALSIGAAVKSGDRIGKVGDTGSAALGKHLHLTRGKETTSVFTGKSYSPYKFIKLQVAKQKLLKKKVK